jgi:hypothetical protein
MTATRRAPAGETHKWEFKARFRRKAFGWRSQPAITRIRQAVAEIKKIAKKDALLAAEGAGVYLRSKRARRQPSTQSILVSQGSTQNLQRCAPATRSAAHTFQHAPFRTARAEVVAATQATQSNTRTRHRMRCLREPKMIFTASGETVTHRARR